MEKHVLLPLFFSSLVFFCLIKYHSDCKHTFVIVKKDFLCSGNGDSAGTLKKTHL